MPQTPYETLLNDLRSPDPARQNHVFKGLLEATSNPVDCAYEVWEDLLHAG